MKKIFKLTLIFLLLPIFSQAAAPSISSVSGTVATGQMLTIIGSSMVDQLMTGWDPWFTATRSGFEGISPAGDGYNGGVNEPTITYDTSVKLMGNKSIKGHTSGMHQYSNYGSEAAYTFEPALAAADIYMRIYSRWNSNVWPNEDIKYWWLGGGETQFLNLRPNGNSAPAQISFYAPSVNNDDWMYGNIPGGAIQNNRWYCIELHLRKSGNPPYIVEVWVDGERVIYTTNATNGPSKNSWGWEANTNYWSTPSDFLQDHWQDGFVVSSQRVYPASVIEIGNSSNYATAEKAYQVPVFLSDGSIQVTANLAGLGVGPYYLFVTNNRQERSAAYTLSGSEGDTTAPSVPGGLSVR